MFSLNKKQNTNNDGSYVSRIIYGPFEMEKSDFLCHLSIRGKKSVTISYRSLLIDREQWEKKIAVFENKRGILDFFDDIYAFSNPVESFSIFGTVTGDAERKRALSLFNEKILAQHSFVVDKKGLKYLYIEFYSKTVIDSESIKVELDYIFPMIYFVFMIFISVLCFAFHFWKSHTYNEMPFRLKL